MMDFLISDTFTDSLARLTGDEQKAAKQTAFDLQLNPANPGMNLHRLDRARDKRFWSVRVSSDVRLIVHRTDASLLLCYVDHHDRAYRWAERRKLETHPKTGAAQLVEIRETVREIAVPQPAGPDRGKAALFKDVADEVLLGFGVPEEWLQEVRRADEDGLLDLADHLPAEAAEALLELATGGRPEAGLAAPASADPFAHPDAQRRFRIMDDVEELQRALEYPWERWTVFLHPAQHQIVEREYNGPARVSGSAGTGKTIVALHRAVFLARRHPEARILLATFSEPLANALRWKLGRLVGRTPGIAERIEVQTVGGIGRRLHERLLGTPALASRETIRGLIDQAAAGVEGGRFSQRFLLGEWEDVVDAWQLDGWDAYRDVRRLGRKTRLSEAQRAALWSVFERVRRGLAERRLTTVAGMLGRVVAELAAHERRPFDFAVVDEAQDLGVPQLRFLAALVTPANGGLFFAGDLGQRIFQTPFSWRSLGVDVRGRSRTLRINYRTSHQIRTQADRLLGPELSDVDGMVEVRRGTVSAFNGPEPRIETFETAGEECRAVADWLRQQCANGMAAREIGVFVRAEAQLERAKASVQAAGQPLDLLDGRGATAGGVAIGTMHLAKGLEFRAVAVIACDDEVIPLQERIEAVGDEADLAEVYDTERHLLYVACTRARDHLFVSGVEPATEFLDDMRG